MVSRLTKDHLEKKYSFLAYALLHQKCYPLGFSVLFGESGMAKLLLIGLGPLLVERTAGATARETQQSPKAKEDLSVAAI